MIKLSDRLDMIGRMVDQGSTVIDVGTDHGFLPISLWKDGIAKRVYMCDISKGSLEKARENWTKFFQSIQGGSDPKTRAKGWQIENFSKEIQFCLGDGLKVIEASLLKNQFETTTVIVAGMGGNLIKDIMAEDTEKTSLIEKFIFQPRNGTGELRHWLTQNDFEIVKEGLVKEGKYICEVICVKNADNSKRKPKQYRFSVETDKTSVIWELPLSRTLENAELLLPFIKRKIAKEEFALTEIKSKGQKNIEKNRDRIEVLNQNIETLKDLVEGNEEYEI